MDLPSAELAAPGPIATAVSQLSPGATVATVSGKTRDLSQLHGLENLEYLWISGVNEPAAHVVSELRGLRRLVVHDLRVASVRPFAELSHLTELAIAGSSKLKSLAGIEKLTRLRVLVLFDNCNYTTIEALTGLQALETLCLEGGWSKPLRLDSLAPLGRLGNLRRLRLASIRVADNSLRPLHQLRALRQVFIAKAFGAAELRALAGALPDAHGEFVDSFRDAS